jgi:hypothetical protein
MVSLTKEKCQSIILDLSKKLLQMRAYFQLAVRLTKLFSILNLSFLTDIIFIVSMDISIEQKATLLGALFLIVCFSNISIMRYS